MDLVERQIDGTGISEAQWQACGWLQTLPEARADTLFAGVSRVVVVSPHPDDEVLACGGLMACAHAAGLPVVVVSVTDGEACYPDHAVWLPQQLREERQRELDRALACLGLANVERHAWHIGDGTVSQHEAEVAARLFALLRQDDLVLAPWMLDAHPDHEAVGRACARAAGHRGCARLEFPVWGWHWVAPEQAPRMWSPARRFRLSPQVQQRKRAAIDQFATQTGAAPGLDGDPILPDAVLQRFQRDYEVLLG